MQPISLPSFWFIKHHPNQQKSKKEMQPQFASQEIQNQKLLPSNPFIDVQKNENLTNLRNLLDMKLHQYEDIDDCDFQIVEENFQEELRKAKQYQATYMHQHSNVVPIGTNYQALIPQILPEEHYKMRSRQMLKRLMILKVNDPIKLKAFTQQYQVTIKKYFEQFDLTEEDYSLMYNNYKQYGNEGDVSFQKYLDKTLIYWNKYFLAKQHKLASKSMTKKKKKKNKGSIPI